MTLREQFTKEVEKKFEGNHLQILFNSSNQDYITWLENKIEEDLEECIGCSEKFYFESMKQDYAGENYCPECASEMFPVMKAEYDEMVKNGEIEPND